VALTPAQIEQFRQEGFLTGIPVFSPAECARFRDTAEQFQATHPDDRDWAFDIKCNLLFDRVLGQDAPARPHSARVTIAASSMPAASGEPHRPPRSPRAMVSAWSSERSITGPSTRPSTSGAGS
jgi:hypothetical protein